MSNNATDFDLHMTACPRHSDVETNLRCARCEDPICPKCMVYAPVGSKCPDCASIGGPQIFKVTQSDLIRIGVVAGLAAIALGAVAAFLLTSLWTLDTFAGINPSIKQIVFGLAQFAAAIGVSQVMILVGGRKYSTSLRILAAALSLLFYVAEVMFIGVFGQIFPTLLVQTGIATQLPVLIGFAFGTYYAMQRFKGL